MKKAFIVICFLISSYQNLFGQGLNHAWLLGYGFGTSPNARINFTNSTDTVITEQRIIPFRGSTQANISDSIGNFLMSSNGIWMANANNDTMQNGSELNPNSFTSSWPNGLPIPNGNLILPYPEHPTQYVLFHQTGTNQNIVPSTEIYYSVIDMSLDAGLGGVDSTQKNIIALSDTFGWGLSACKHANGRDWWIIALSDSATIAYKFLLNPSGVQYVSSQALFVPAYPGWAGQPVFSSDGTKFSYGHGYTNDGIYWYHDVRLFDFDRCTGNFSNPNVIDLTDGNFGFGISFSPDSKYLYASSYWKIFQINTDTSNIPASLTIVALNDSFAFPFPPIYTDFYLMYLAANGRIYVTSGNSSQTLHFIEYPDSSGTACNVQQHAFPVPCWIKGSTPVHPNYYLGCDTTGGCTCLTTEINELTEHDFHFRIYPNPVLNNILNIGYQLPQNKSGLFQIYDITGKVVFKYTLPTWSNEQSFKLPELRDGVYNCVITSGEKRVSQKMALIKE